jgi:hypothetical protein
MPMMSAAESPCSFIVLLFLAANVQKTANIAKSSPNYLEVCRKILIFATTNKSINRVL